MILGKSKECHYSIYCSRHLDELHKGGAKNHARLSAKIDYRSSPHFLCIDRQISPPESSQNHEFRKTVSVLPSEPGSRLDPQGCCPSPVQQRRSPPIHYHVKSQAPWDLTLLIHATSSFLRICSITSRLSL